MKKFICLFFCCVTLYISGVNAQTTVTDKPVSAINWTTTKNWKIYYVRSRGGFNYSIDTLQYIKSVSLNDDSMKNFLQSAAEIPVDRTPVFMGYYVASCQLPNGKAIKVEISQHGRFFYEEKEKRYYQLAESIQSDWLDYLTTKWRKLEVL